MMDRWDWTMSLRAGWVADFRLGQWSAKEVRIGEDGVAYTESWGLAPNAENTVPTYSPVRTGRRIHLTEAGALRDVASFMEGDAQGTWGLATPDNPEGNETRLCRDCDTPASFFTGADERYDHFCPRHFLAAFTECPMCGGWCLKSEIVTVKISEGGQWDPPEYEDRCAHCTWIGAPR